jgi:iron complex outermembrane receptor protein
VSPSYRIAANTNRGDVGLVGHAINSHGDVLTLRSSVNQQWQRRQYGDSTENDRRGTLLAEATFARSAGMYQTLLGAAAQQDGLWSEHLADARYEFFTASVFGQETFTPDERLSVTATARIDRHNRYGTFLSPRLSALVHLGEGWAARISGGQGFFAPTPLVEKSDAVGLSRVRGFGDLGAETIRQASADLTRQVGSMELTGTVFRSELRHAVVVRESASAGTITLLNSTTPTRTSGASLYALYNRDPVSITALYGYTKSREWSPDKNRIVDTELTPRHSAGLDFAIDSDESGTRAGLEIFYTGRQSLEDDPYRKVSVPYTTVGILVEQKIARISIFANGENLTGVRQTRFDPFILPGLSGTGNWTTPQWAPLDGRMINAGLRVSF